MASLARLIGAELPLGAAPDSRDQLDTWLGQSDISCPFAVEMAANRALSVRVDNWKYIEPSRGGAFMKLTGTETGYAPTPQLYNLKKEKGEQTNLYDTQPDVAKEMAGLLNSLRGQK